jgi:hypothetical protein
MLSMKALHIQVTQLAMPQSSVTVNSKCDRFQTTAIYWS